MRLFIDVVNHGGEIWWQYVVHATWQASLLAVVIVLIVKLGKRWPSPLRYWLLVIALIKFAIPPMLSVPTGVFTHVGPQVAFETTAAETRLAPTSSADLEKHRGVDNETESAPSYGASSQHEFYLPESETYSGTETPIDRSVEIGAPIVTSKTAKGIDTAEESHGMEGKRLDAQGVVAGVSELHWKGWLMLAHFVGTFIVILWIFRQLLLLRSVLRRAEHVTEGPVYDCLMALCRQMQINRVPKLLVSPDPVAPMAYGIFRPTVMVPPSAVDGPSNKRLDTMLAHELAHVRRKDPWVNCFQLFVSALWWFNPLFWILNREIRCAREDCCDDSVLSQGDCPDETYCDALLHSASRLAVYRQVGTKLGFADRLHPLGWRIKRIMDRTLRRASRLSIWGILLVIILATLLLPGPGCREKEVSDEEVENTAEPGSRPELNQYLLDAAKEGNLAGVKSLLRRGAFINTRDDEGNTPLHLALAAGNKEVAEYLLDSGADVTIGGKAGNQPLHIVLQKRFEDLAIQVIEAGADVNARNASEERPLQLAIGSGCKKAARFMIEHGADVNAANWHGPTPLMKAAEVGDINMTSLLLDKGADVNATSEGGWTAVRYAARNGHSAVLEILIANGANIRARTAGEAGPLVYAASKGHRDTVETLIKAYKNKDELKEDAGHALISVAFGGHKEVVKILLDAGADVNWESEGGHTPLTQAVNYAKPNMVKLLLEHGASVELPEKSNTRLVSRAFETKDMESLKLLLDAGADPNVRGKGNYSVLADAISAGNKEAVKLLLDAGASLDERYGGPSGLISKALEKNHFDIAKMLLDAGVAVDEQDAQGETLLYNSARAGWADAIRFLAENGAKVDEIGPNGYTPLVAAIWQGKKDAVDALIEEGADFTAADSSKKTPLFAAVSAQKADIVELLINKGANVNVINEAGYTPLHTAVGKKNRAIIKLLLEAGADPRISTKLGETPLDRARKGKDAGIIKLLGGDATEKPEGEETEGEGGVEGGEEVKPPPSETPKGNVKRNWGPEQATGEPDTQNAGDHPTAWASQTPDGQDEWLLLEYEKAVRPKVVNVYETFNPGALCKVTFFDAEDREVVAWEGDDPIPVNTGKGVSGVKVGRQVETKKVKIYLKSKEVKGWNEIDAVGLIDKDDKVHWAVSATASSTFGVGSALSQGSSEGTESAAADDSEDYVPQASTPEGLYVEGSKLRNEGRWRSAVKTWQTLIDKFPDRSRAGCAAVYMGQLQLSKKDYEGAEKSLRQAAEKLGHHKYGNGVEVGGYGYFYLIQLYCDTEQYQKAGEALKALVEKYPYATGHRMGDALMSLRAKRWFYEKLSEQGVDMKPLDDLIAEQRDSENFDRLNSRQLYLIAHILKDEEETDKAIEAFKKVTWKFPKESFTPYAAVFAFELQLNEKDYDGAAETAQKMIKDFPDAKLSKGGPLEAIGYYDLGVVHFEKTEYKEAAEMFQKAVQDFPTAADMNGVSLKSLVTQHYLKALKEKGFVVEGVDD